MGRGWPFGGDGVEMTRSRDRSEAPGSSPAESTGVRRAIRAALAVAVAVGAVALMVRLSVWQWDRGRQRGSLLNYTYGIEWMLFAVLTVAGLVRLRREGKRTTVEAEPDRRPDAPVVGPPLQPGEKLEEVTWTRLRRRIGLDGGVTPARSTTSADTDAAES